MYIGMLGMMVTLDPKPDLCDGFFDVRWRHLKYPNQTKVSRSLEMSSDD